MTLSCERQRHLSYPKSVVEYTVLLSADLVCSALVINNTKKAAQVAQNKPGDLVGKSNNCDYNEE